VAALALATLVPAGTAAADSTVTRLHGDDRYGTSAAVADFVAPEGATVWVASGTDFADALTGAAAAGAQGEPILLVHPDRVPASVILELERIKPDRIMVLGGATAVSPKVVEQLTDHAPVTRVAGQTRYETAAAIADSFEQSSDTVYLAAGYNFPDALTGAAAAGASDSPVLLARTATALSAATEAALNDLQPSSIVVVGGPSVISRDLEEQLASQYAPVTRLAGADRYSTAVAISQKTPAGPERIYFASGLEFPDALAGAAAAAAEGSPVLLVRPDTVPGDVVTEVRRLDAEEVVVLGGPAAVSQDVANWTGTPTGAPPRPAPAPPVQSDLSAYDRQMVDIINTERAKAGVPALRYHAPLREGALAHSRLMLRTGSFAHATPEVMRDDTIAAGCGRGWGENIFHSWGRTTTDAAFAMQQYMNSPGHRANILDPGYRYVATGTVIEGTVLYNTQRFAGDC